MKFDPGKADKQLCNMMNTVRVLSTFVFGPLGAAHFSALPQRPLTMAHGEFRSPFKGPVLGRFERFEKDLQGMVPYELFVTPWGDFSHFKIDVPKIEERLGSQLDLLNEVRLVIDEIHGKLSPMNLIDLKEVDPIAPPNDEPDDPASPSKRPPLPPVYYSGGVSSLINGIRPF